MKQAPDELLADLRKMMPNYPDKDIRLILDLARHATKEAQATMQNVSERAPTELRIETMAIALIIMRQRCEFLLDTMSEVLGRVLFK